jgi:hypothetical protein
MSFEKAKIRCVTADPTEYHAETGKRGTPEFCVSSSSLRSFWACPDRWVRGYNLPESEAKDWGSLVDTLHLTPDQFDDRYAVQPETYESEKGERKDWNNNANVCRAWTGKQVEAGRKIVKPALLDLAVAAISRLAKDELISSWRAACDVQVWLEGEWHDTETGLIVPVKALLDYAPRADTEFCDCLGDFKTTRNAAQMAWSRWCQTGGGYHIQAGWNTDLYVAATKEDRNTFCFVLQESFEPFQPAKRMLTQKLLGVGRGCYAQMMAMYCKCLKLNRWPGYDETDEAIQGWVPVDALPWLEGELLFGPKFQVEPEAEAEAQGDPDDVIP